MKEANRSTLPLLKMELTENHLEMLWACHDCGGTIPHSEIVEAVDLDFIDASALAIQLLGEGLLARGGVAADGSTLYKCTDKGKRVLQQ